MQTENRHDEILDLEVKLEKLEKVLSTYNKSLEDVNRMISVLNSISEIKQELDEIMPMMESEMEGRKRIWEKLEELSSLLSHDKVRQKIKRKFDSLSPEKKQSIRDQLNSLGDAANLMKD